MKSEYAANQALQRVAQPTGWLTPSRCVRRKQSALERFLKAVFRGVAR